MILVTGGAGFIGSNVVDRLIADGYDVTIIDNLSTGKKENINPKADFIFGDVAKFPHISKKFDVIFHLAALARIQPSFKYPKETYDSNALGTFNVLDVARNTKAKVVYAGSSSAYSDIYANPYTYTKWIGEEHCKLYNKVYGLPIGIARFFNVYGPRQIEEGAYATVIAIFEKQKRKRLPLTVTGNGEQRRDFCVTGDTFILMADNSWKPISEIKMGDLVVSFDEEPINRKRNFKIKPVLAISSYFSDNVYEIETEHTMVYATGNHPWLDYKGKYRDTEYLLDKISNKCQTRHIKRFGKPIQIEKFTDNYKHGYLVGALLGDGYCYSRQDAKSHTVYYNTGLSVSDVEFADRFETFATWAGIQIKSKTRNFKYPNSKLAFVRQSCKKQCYYVGQQLIAEAFWENKYFCAGFLSGIYDSEGECHGRTLRISNKNHDILNKIKHCLSQFNFNFTQSEKSNGVNYILLLGGHQEQLRFINIVNPSISRKKINFNNKEVKGDLSHIINISKTNINQKVYNMEVEDTHTYIANGLLCHNTHVFDIVDGLIRLSQKDYQADIFNFGTGINYSINEVANLFGGPIEYIPKRPGEAWITLADITESNVKLGYKPKYKLDEYIISQ